MGANVTYIDGKQISGYVGLGLGLPVKEHQGIFGGN